MLESADADVAKAQDIFDMASADRLREVVATNNLYEDYAREYLSSVDPETPTKQRNDAVKRVLRLEHEIAIANRPLLAELGLDAVVDPPLED